MKWCSWCFEMTPQHKISACRITRDVYQCEKCGKETCQCMTCSFAMARRFPDHADKLCYHCKLLIPSWEEGAAVNKEALKVKKRCSWCFQHTSHSLFNHNTATRSEYVCDGCGERTLVCMTCKIGMARNHAGLGDRTCALCDGTIQDWDHPYETSENLLKTGWCSWCITNSVHELKNTKVVRRNRYRCLQCNNDTLACYRCTNLARCGLLWNDSLCVHCYGEDEGKALDTSWEAMKNKRDKICAQQRDLNRVIAELERQSTYREKARKEGVERPFLLLVSMPTMMRNQIACQLGWTIFTQDYFGDSHAEAFHILCDSREGMQARANQSYERLNPLAHNCNWYDIMVRVIQAAFHTDIYHENYSASQEACVESGSRLVQDTEVKFLILLSERMKAEIEASRKQKQQKEEHAAALSAGRDPSQSSTFERQQKIDHDEGIQHLQAAQGEELHSSQATEADKLIAVDTIDKLQERTNSFCRRRKRLTDCAKANNPGDEETAEVADQIISKEEATLHAQDDERATPQLEQDSEELEESILYIKAMVLKNTGINREEVAQYAIQLGMACAGVGKLSISIMCLKLGAALIPATAGAALPAVAALSLLSTPMFILSVFSLTTGAIKLGFGSSEGRLVMPVISILNQRLLLAIEDINIDDYY